MIESGDIHARIDERDGMVRFLENPEQYDDAATAARMDEHIRRSVAVSAKMQTVHDAVRDEATVVEAAVATYLDWFTP